MRDRLIGDLCMASVYRLRPLGELRRAAFGDVGGHDASSAILLCYQRQRWLRIRVGTGRPSVCFGQDDPCRREGPVFSGLHEGRRIASVHSLQEIKQQFKHSLVDTVDAAVPQTGSGKTSLCGKVR